MSPPGGPAGVFDRAAATYEAVGVPWFGPIAEGLVAELAPGPGDGHGQRAMWEAVLSDRREEVRARVVERGAQLGLGPGEIVLREDVRCTLGHRAVPVGG